MFEIPALLDEGALSEARDAAQPVRNRSDRKDAARAAFNE